jgi:FdhD protein
VPTDPTAAARVVRFPSGVADADRVAVEEPVEIRVDGEPLAVTMRTPGDDPELAAGFCLTEGVIDHPDELERADACTEADYGNVVLVALAGAARDRWRAQADRARRDLYLSSSCGLCGTRTIDRLARRVAFLGEAFTVSAEVLGRLPAAMADAQEAFARTGGLHAAALFDTAGRLRLLREDVGRHNAVDKVVGALLLSGQLPCGPAVLLVSGRASFELVQKAARAGVGVLAAVGAPSSLAVEAADRFGMTLVGFLRPDRFNVYARPDRVGGAASER